MQAPQLTRIFTDINQLSTYNFNTWFMPFEQFSYIVLKDNSLLYINDRDMWYFDNTDELLYVANALINTTTNTLQMPTTGIVAEANLDRVTTIIDFENINHVVLHHVGEYLGGRR